MKAAICKRKHTVLSHLCELQGQGKLTLSDRTLKVVASGEWGFGKGVQSALLRDGDVLYLVWMLFACLAMIVKNMNCEISDKYYIFKKEH